MADQRMEMLARVPLFAGSSKRQLRGVLDWTKEFRYKPGATIVRDGAKGQELFVRAEHTPVPMTATEAFALGLTGAAVKGPRA